LGRECGIGTHAERGHAVKYLLHARQLQDTLERTYELQKRENNARGGQSTQASKACVCQGCIHETWRKRLIWRGGSSNRCTRQPVPTAQTHAKHSVIALARAACRHKPKGISHQHTPEAEVNQSKQKHASSSTYKLQREIQKSTQVSRTHGTHPSKTKPSEQSCKRTRPRDKPGRIELTDRMQTKNNVLSLKKRACWAQSKVEDPHASLVQRAPAYI
jgi:hypothetical protein